MVKAVDAKPQGRGGLARLRRECFRFREEVECIRSFQGLQLRWPPLARLEIGCESSEEGGSVWDSSSEVQTCDLPLTDMKTVATLRGPSKDLAEVFPQNPLFFSMNSSANGRGDILAGTTDICEKVHKDFIMEADVRGYGNEGMDDRERHREFTEIRKEDDVCEAELALDSNVACKIAEQRLVPGDLMKEVLDPLYDQSFLESLEDITQGQFSSDAFMDSSSRIAATALYTANPRYKYHEISPQCSSHINVNESEGSQLVGLSTSNICNGENLQGMEVQSEQVLPSTLEIAICSPSGHSGCTAMTMRNEVSPPVKTVFPEDVAGSCDESFHRLLSFLAPVATSCSPDVCFKSEKVQSRVDLNVPEISRPSAQMSRLASVEHPKRMLEEVSEQNLAPVESICVQNQTATMPGDETEPLRTKFPLSQFRNTQHQNGSLKQSQPKPVLLSDNVGEDQTPSSLYVSGLGANSFLATHVPLPQEPKSVFIQNESGPDICHAKNNVSGSTDLVALCAMDRIARLGEGSTRDCAMAAQMAVRIKDALKKLGSSHRHLHPSGIPSVPRTSDSDLNASSPNIYRRTESLNGSRAEEPAQVQTIGSNFVKPGGLGDAHVKSQRSESHFFSPRSVNENLSQLRDEHLKNGRMESYFVSQRSLNQKFTDLLDEQVKNQRSESHFFSQRDLNQNLSDHSIKCKPDTCQVDIAIPVEPDLYLQHVIAALQSGSETAMKELSINTPNSARGDAVADCPRLHQDVGVGTHSSEVHSTRCSFVPGKASKHDVDTQCFRDHENQNEAARVAREECNVKKKLGMDGRVTYERDSGGCYPFQKSRADCRSDSQQAFSVEIKAPPGSVVDVDLGGCSTVLDQQQPVYLKGVDNNHKQRSSEVRHVRFSDDICTTQSPDSSHHGQPVVKTIEGFSSPPQNLDFQKSSASHPESHFGGISSESLNVPPFRVPRVEEGRLSGETLLSVANFSPSRGLRVDPKFPRTMRFTTQESLLESFDRKIADLVEKAKQLNDETSIINDNCGRGLQVQRPQQLQLEKNETFGKAAGVKRESGFMSPTNSARGLTGSKESHQSLGHTECIRARREDEIDKADLGNTPKQVSRAEVSILQSPPKSATRSPRKHAVQSPKSQDLNQRPENHTSLAARKLQEFEVAAGSLADELNMLMTNRQPAPNLDRRCRNQKKVAWAIPEVREGGRSQAVKEQTVQSVKQPGSLRLLQSRAIKYLRVDEAAEPLAARTISDVGRTDKTLRRQVVAHHPSSKHCSISGQLSADKYSKRENTARPTLEVGGRPPRPASSHKSEKSQGVQERGFERDRETVAVLAGDSFDYNVFRQELRELQAERKKMESLMKTRPKVDIVPHQHNGLPSTLPSQKGNTKEVCSRTPNQNARSQMVVTSGDPNLVGGKKRDRSASSPVKESDKKLIRSHFGRCSFSESEPLNPDDLVELSDISQNCFLNTSAPEIASSGNKNVSVQDSSMSKKPTQKTSVQTRGAQHKEKNAECRPKEKIPGFLKRMMRSMPSKHTSQVLLHHEDRVQLAEHPLLDQHKQRVRSTLRPKEAKKMSSSATMPPNNDILEIDGSQNTLLHGESESIHPSNTLGSPSTELALREATPLTEPLGGVPSAFKGIDAVNPRAHESVSALLEPCDIHQVEVEDAGLLGTPLSDMYPTTDLELVSQLVGIADESSQEVKSKLDVVRQKTPRNISVDLISKVQDVADCSQRCVHTFDSNGQLLHKVEDDSKDGDSPDNGQTESSQSQAKSQEQKHEPEVSPEVVQKAEKFHGVESSSPRDSQNDDSWSGSLASVLAAYEAAKTSAIFMLSSALPVGDSKGTQVGKVPFIPKLNLEKIRSKKEKSRPRQSSRVDETGQLRLRSAQKDHINSKQGSTRLAGSAGGKDSLQILSNNCEFQNANWKVPKLTALGPRKREDWDNSTDMPKDLYKTDRNIRAKEAAEALIARMVRDEQLNRQQRRKTKKLQLVRALEMGRRKRLKNPVDLRMYENSLSLLKVKEHPTLIKTTSPKVGRQGAKERSRTTDFPIEQPTVQNSSKQKSKDTAVVKQSDLQTEDHVLDELTMAFKKRRDLSIRRSRESGGNLITEDVRESVEFWLETSGGFDYLVGYNELGEEDLLARQASASSKLTKTSCSIAAGVGTNSDMGLLEDACQNQIASPSIEMQAPRICSSRTESSQRIEKGGMGNSTHQDSSELSIAIGSKTGIPTYDLSSNVKGKLTEDQEIEIALLEIVLQTILKDDQVKAHNTVDTLEQGTSPAPADGQPASTVEYNDRLKILHEQLAGFSGTQEIDFATACSPPAETAQEIPAVFEDRTHDEVLLDPVVEAAPTKVSSPGSAAKEHESDSEKSSGGDWPEYKCLAELQSGSESEDEHSKSKVVDDEEIIVDRNQDVHEEEVLSERSPIPSSSRLQTAQMLPPVSLAQPMAVNTRPSCSVVNSGRAAERQNIEFPGITSLAFGYPSPRPPRPPLVQPVAEPVVEKSSVSIQTADLSVPQYPFLGPSPFPVPFYCLPDGRPILPPYSMYPPPFYVPQYLLPNVVPVAVQDPQLIPHNMQALRGGIPTIPPPLTTPVPCPKTEVFCQTSPMPLSSTLQQTRAPKDDTSCASPPPLKSPASKGTSKPCIRTVTSTVQKGVRTLAYSAPAAKSPHTFGKVSSSHLRRLHVHITEPADNSDSLTSSESCLSSPTTPSTCVSSPEHEARVASALAHPTRDIPGSVRLLFPYRFTDEAELEQPEAREEQSQENQELEAQAEDQDSLHKDEDEQPGMEPLIAENGWDQLRVEVQEPALEDPSDQASSSSSKKLDTGPSLSVSSARSMVLAASYDGSGSSEGSLKHSRCRTFQTFSPQMSQAGTGDVCPTDLESRSQAKLTQTSSLSSGEIRYSVGRQSNVGYGNLRRPARDYLTETQESSDGEVEIGELPSEGEYVMPYPGASGSHRSMPSARPTKLQDNTSEPGEVPTELQDNTSEPGEVPRRAPACRSPSEGSGGVGSSLSEGEVRPHP